MSTTTIRIPDDLKARVAKAEIDAVFVLAIRAQREAGFIDKGAA